MCYNDFKLVENHKQIAPPILPLTLRKLLGISLQWIYFHFNFDKNNLFMLNGKFFRNYQYQFRIFVTN